MSVAIRFEEVVDIHVTVTKIGTKSITYGFKFFRDTTPIADGSITVVCCLFERDTTPQSVAVPQAFIDAIKPYVV